MISQYCPHCSHAHRPTHLWHSTDHAYMCPNCKMWIDVKTSRRWVEEPKTLISTIIDFVFTGKYVVYTKKYLN